MHAVYSYVAGLTASKFTALLTPAANGTCLVETGYELANPEISFLQFGTAYKIRTR